MLCVEKLDLSLILVQKVDPLIRVFLGMLEEIWQRHFTQRFLSRLVALEIQALLQKPGRRVPAGVKVATSLRAHAAALLQGCTRWGQDSEVSTVFRGLNHMKTAI